MERELTATKSVMDQQQVQIIGPAENQVCGLPRGSGHLRYIRLVHLKADVRSWRSLFPRANCIMMRHRAVTETFDLGKMNQIQCVCFRPWRKPSKTRRVDQIFSCDKPFQVEAIRGSFRKRLKETAFYLECFYRRGSRPRSCSIALCPRGRHF